MKHGLKPPKPAPRHVVRNNKMVYILDRHKQAVYSELIRRAGLQPPAFVRLLRGETLLDSRPNKALEIPTAHVSWADYQYQARWKNIVMHGVQPKWCKEFSSQPVPPPNHGSAKRALNTIIKNLRAGQDSNRYLILDIDLLPLLEGVTCSPFGAVQKGEVDLEEDARIIHDLSFPPGSSVNDNTVSDDDIDISYDGAEAISNRIVDVAEIFPKLQRMMTADVNGAFRNIPIAAQYVGRFAGTIPELGILVIDLCCPFGWKISPSSYWVAGAAINHLYANASPEWPGQPVEAQGNFNAKACGLCLGLDWDLEALTVSIPPEKVEKAHRRIVAMLNRTKTTRTLLLKLLGSLRHVVTCIRSAAPFFQRVATLARQAPRFGAIGVSEQATGDLRWFDSILAIGRLNGIPLQHFTRRHEPNIDIYMDASDRGLCALFPARKEYLQVQFDAKELALIRSFNDHSANEFCINVRELMSAVFASLVWGHVWADSSDKFDSHIKFWIDNSPAVSWNNRKSSRNSYGQMLLRILGMCEVRYGFYTSAGHIPGINNEMADAGSRVWQSPSLARKFANLSFGWKQVQIPTDCRNLSRLWARYCVLGRLPSRQERITHVDGDSGSPGAR
ncbi:hypothetical protein PHYSODRAFT_491796 [Phytophthora sojae]|uniref:Uncharacterized protein n=1 Tax=Phytophthora sojae (strain P6497) TaxID=1094619 RepID=G4Z6S4_PHYSP|nr:hypothetical protein PHYSODRAFT_491796 [Phytophthora sojae]EGZ20340.1 hypothetical protein PHYSODRAFT_491796 [Phytophthora sojae]|eukprot:XP_009523057.1 hypothetical protein PHYSODRAFT_491796 [Phytophthora sojae]